MTPPKNALPPPLVVWVGHRRAEPADREAAGGGEGEGGARREAPAEPLQQRRRLLAGGGGGMTRNRLLLGRNGRYLPQKGPKRDPKCPVMVII